MTNVAAVPPDSYSQSHCMSSPHPRIYGGI